ncbi:MAG: DUF1062 domain-containing protein [Parvibaculaceae bacterium]
MRALQVQWTIVPRTAPQPWIKCGRCGTFRPFRPSGRTRLNANGKTLDAWLIYKCVSCDSTWNRPILERRNVRDLGSSMLQDLQGGEAGWIRDLAFDVASLRRNAARIDEFADADVRKTVTGDATGDWTSLDIELVVPLPINLRLDRLLSMELGLPRSRLRTLHEHSRLCVHPSRKDVLRRPIRSGLRITIEVLEEGDLASLRRSVGD